MLLRHTPKEVKERKALTINPAKTCQPVGAMYAALGVHGCLPHSHGSQGCCSYHRSVLTRHYKDPIMAGTSAFTEGSSVFGGQANLMQALTNMFTIYNPDLVAVHTTCLSETIGDDLNQICSKAIEDGKVPAGKKVIYCNTPSYIGSHVTGFSNMCTGIVKGLVEHTGVAKDQVNILPGWVEPSDMREIKRIAKDMGAKIVLYPDTSDVVDSPQTGEYKMYPDGGATVEDIASSGDSIKTLACGAFASEDAAKLLDSSFKVPYEVLDIPVGLSASDRFITALSEAARVTVPAAFVAERGRLVDVIADMTQYLHGKKVAIFGDPDQLIPMVEFLLDLDMIPTHVISGTPGKKFTKKIQELCAEKAPNVQVQNGAQADMFLLHQWIKNEPVDLLLGNTYGKYIARDEDIPFVRYGFPILDRIGHSYFPTVGYTGGIRLLELMLGAIMDRQDRDADDTKVELVM
ncbi:nitrogenase molybdenum-iron protein subunit beta [Pontiella sulfatireligans]|uniref:Nitrogenase molybdenum-iron protein beta chain n=1 Tax=Pontiella sulfatireligans TaxID=2750658 RepID=A0A6C2UT41_9BACT|nr:nitrogenase molybdenum-iron protein subunit beta [Pontiella sulfatireligans]VGO22414.1 Nitrogenase molybdenum-iron protein beta chain [Pontiella sulfatireligans]